MLHKYKISVTMPDLLLKLITCKIINIIAMDKTTN